VVIIAGQRILASDMLVEHDANGHHVLGPLWFTPQESTGTRSVHDRYFGVLLDLATEYALFNVRIPDYFVSLSKARVIIIPTTAGTIDWTCQTAAGAAGEDESQAVDSATADGAGVVDDQLTAIDVSGAFNGLSLAPGDLVGVKFILDALATTTQVFVIGLELGY